MAEPQFLSQLVLERLKTVYAHSSSRAGNTQPLFASALKDFLEASGSIRELQTGEILFTQDEPADSLYWIESGILCILKGDIAVPRLLAFRHPGQVVGEIALIEDVPRTATVAATTPTRLKYLNKEDFHAMLRQKPEIGLEIMRLLSARLREIQPAEYSDGLYDHLTGALSRQAFDSLVYEEIERARHFRYSFALAFIDLDHFKQINDNYGHPRGDDVLVMFTKLLMEFLRSSDLLFRYGGDEFVLILPGTDQISAPALLQRALDYVKCTPVPGDPPLALSFSAGISYFPSDGETLDKLKTVSDQRLYISKNKGRGKVTGILLQPV